MYKTKSYWDKKNGSSGFTVGINQAPHSKPGRTREKMNYASNEEKEKLAA
ncbi:MAG: hypothetical protein HQK53_17825 [Oligoflexia bacterium]|nr:hypothetical protein [Oligoflexia bacterium]